MPKSSLKFVPNRASSVDEGQCEAMAAQAMCALRALAYEAGAKKVKPQIAVLANYVGVTSEAWNNPPKGKELGLAQYDQGADIIFAAAGASGLGVFDAAEERKKFAIGVDANQNWTKPGLILTSMLKRNSQEIMQSRPTVKAVRLAICA